MASGFWGVNGFFLALEVLLTLGVIFTGSKGNNGLRHTLCTTAVFCCWLMWIIVYMSQMHPLVRPQLQNA